MPDRALLLLADIGGYTEFMRLHRLKTPPLTARIRETIGFGIRAFPRVIGLRHST